MTKPNVSSQEILESARIQLLEKGTDAFSIANIAKTGGFSVGSVYNYFSDKNDLLSSVLAVIWSEILLPVQNKTYTGFEDCLRSVYAAVEGSREVFPGFLQENQMLLSLPDSRKEAQKIQSAFTGVSRLLISLLEQDRQIRPGVFTSSYRPEDFVRQILRLMLESISMQEGSLHALLKLSENALY